MMRAAALAAVLILGGCSQAGQSGGKAQDPYAGLDSEILKWRADIVRTDALCQSQAEGQKCEGFEVSCKAMRAITPDDQAKGVSARVVAAINFSGYDAKHKQSQLGARAAEFSKSASGWARAEHPPVNMSTCGDL
jgi:hypothetical protein